jgi:hypothetical protein
VLAKAAGLHVTRLLRVAFGPIRLGTLRPGAARELRPAEVEALRREAAQGGGGRRWPARGPGARLPLPGDPGKPPRG